MTNEDTRAMRKRRLAILKRQRLIAPLLAIVVPVMAFAVIAVVTAINARPKKSVEITIAAAEPDPPVEPPEPPEPPPEDPPPAEDPPINITVDVAAVPGIDAQLPPSPVSPTKAVSVKPAPNDFVKDVKSPVRMKDVFGGRGPTGVKTATGGGDAVGDARTEHAVLKALRWLKKTQRSDGSWSPSPVSNTGLALLAFLAHGETPRSAEFGATVTRAAQYLVDAQYRGDDGTVRFRGSDGNEYAFLIAAYALAETYAMTGHPSAKDAAAAALARIVAGQSSTGGWDYRLNSASNRDDMSFEGWALQALKAGKLADIPVEGLDACVKRAMRCLKERNFKNGGFNYTAGGNPTGLTAAGCLAMQLLGYGDNPEVAASLEYMAGWLPVFEPTGAAGATPGANPQYYCYYATQCKYQAGMKAGARPADNKKWKAWNAAMKALYPPSINTLAERIAGPDGTEHEIGYWTNSDGTCKVGGDTMATCLCALQLMVYYRYLPTSRADGEKGRDTAPKPSAASASDAINVNVDI